MHEGGWLPLKIRVKIAERDRLCGILVDYACVRARVPCPAVSRVVFVYGARGRCVSKNHKSGCHDSAPRFSGGLNGGWLINRLAGWLAGTLLALALALADRCSTVVSHSSHPPPFLPLPFRKIYRGSDRPRQCPYERVRIASRPAEVKNPSRRAVSPRRCPHDTRTKRQANRAKDARKNRPMISVRPKGFRDIASGRVRPSFRSLSRVNRALNTVGSSLAVGTSLRPAALHPRRDDSRSSILCFCSETKCIFGKIQGRRSKYLFLFSSFYA